MWALLLVPAIGGIVATRVAAGPLVVLDGLRPGPVDSFGGEIFVVRGDEVVSFDGAANVRVVFEGVPADTSAIAWDPAERLCWASGSVLGCVDLITSKHEDFRFGTSIRDIQVACDGVFILLGDPARIVHRTSTGALTSWPVDADIAGLARGTDCTNVGVWAASRLGDVALADGRFRSVHETHDTHDAVRSGGGWLLRRGDSVVQMGATSTDTTSWFVPGAARVVAGSPNAVLDAAGRLWLLP
ncbi:MAG: hypothetical protein V4850_01105 [Myxococcota bacterium]